MIEGMATAGSAERQGRATSGSAVAAGAASRAAVVVIRGNGLGRRHLITDELVIGYDADRDIVVGDSDALLYARLQATPAGVVLSREPGSEIVIKVNEAAIEEAKLTNGDVVQVGFALLKFIEGPDQVALDAAFHDEIFRLSTIDPVTQAYNRRYFTEAFEREVSRVRRYERSLSLLMIEIDGLMALARERGATAADELMHAVADLLRARARQSDVVGHYDKELLTVLLPEVGVEGARAAAEKLRGRVEQEAFTVDGVEQTCTVSIGVAELDPGHDTVDDLVRLANNRLWVAKDAGGNRIVAEGG
jgi:diguanylate cyclase (GGDEF)-like protein